MQSVNSIVDDEQIPKLAHQITFANCSIEALFGPWAFLRCDYFPTSWPEKGSTFDRESRFSLCDLTSPKGASERERCLFDCGIVLQKTSKG